MRPCAGLTADGISILSLVVAAAGSAALRSFHDPRPAGLRRRHQLRLLCNLLDGMVAVEGGRKSKFGVLYNEVPTESPIRCFSWRWGMPLELLAGLAGGTGRRGHRIYRVLGGTFGLAQDFRGPLAKQHRMAVMTAGCLLGIGEFVFNGGQYLLEAAAWIIAWAPSSPAVRASGDRAAVEGTLSCDLRARCWWVS
jgi:hypothetical protein